MDRVLKKFAAPAHSYVAMDEATNSLLEKEDSALTVPDPRLARYARSSGGIVCERSA